MNILRINNLLRKVGHKFRNFVFKKRLGKKEWSAKIIFYVMGMFDRFEVYSNTKDVGRFDHYVPQFLLKNWKTPDSGKNNPKIFLWSKGSNLLSKDKIGNVAGEIDWDVSSSKGVPSDFVNKKLFAELLEDKASRVIKSINTNKLLDLTFLEESTLAVFISHQITRVPAFRASLSHFFSIGYSRGLIEHNDFGNKDVLVKKVALNQIGITYDQFLDDTPSIIVGKGKPQQLLLSLVIASHIAEKIYRGNLHILELPINSSDEFVTSDNPVIFLDMDRKKILRFVPWWEVGVKDFWIFMPISPRKAVFYCKSKKKDGPVEDNNEDLVQLFNFGQYLCCTNSVFSKSEFILRNHLKLYSSEMRREDVI